jgi:hypothetical protein
VDVDGLPEVPDVNVDVLPKVPDVNVDVLPKAPDEDVDVLPEVPDEVVNPVHGLMVVLVVGMLGTGAVINGLIPPLAISVEPRGIVPPLSTKLELVPGVDSGEAVPAEDTCDDVQLDVEVVDPVAVDPPPSKVELPLVDDPVVLEPIALQVALMAGLRPPGSISVPPSGMPVPLITLEPGTPSGDVAPIAGVLIVVWAWPVPQLNKTAAVITNNRRMGNSCTILPLLRMFGPAN